MFLCFSFQGVSENEARNAIEQAKAMSTSVAPTAGCSWSCDIVRALENSYTELVSGLCLKTKTKDNRKVFLNVCTTQNVRSPPQFITPAELRLVLHSSFQIPKPKDVTDEELLRLIESEDPSSYRVPMSLGEPHAEVDKSWLIVKRRTVNATFASSSSFLSLQVVRVAPRTISLCIQISWRK